MSVLWFDSFDGYITTNNGSLENQNNGSYLSPVGTASTTWPQFITDGVVGGAYRIFCVNNRRYWRKELSFINPIWVGFHFRTSGTGGNQTGILSFRNASDVAIATITCSPAGLVEIRTGDVAGTVIVSSPTNLTSNTWVHLEVMFVQSATVGEIQIRLNGSPWFATAANRNFGAAISNGQLALGNSAFSSGPTFDYDNLCIVDNQGAENNSWMGERNVYSIVPDADTATEQWTLSTGSDSFEILNNVPRTADYITTGTIGNTTIVGLANLPSTDIGVVAVKARVSAQKDGSDPVEVEFGVVSNSVEDTDIVPMTQDSYLWFNHIMEQDPGTTGTWTPGAVNDLQLVVRRAL